MRDVTTPDPIGPLDREDFRSAQRRHRRSARLRAIPAVLAAAAMGIPLGVYLSPVLLALGSLLTDLANLLVPTADLGGVVSGFLDRLLEGDPGTVGSIALVLVIWVVPDVVLLVVAYLLVRWRLGALGGAGIALSLGGRAPRPDDPEEVQLVDVVTELALAARHRWLEVHRGRGTVRVTPDSPSRLHLDDARLSAGRRRGARASHRSGRCSRPSRARR